MADHHLKILIIGGGLCGLATAISSRLAGHSVIVFESAPQLQEIGAGIQITPNGSRLLQRWGVWDTVASSATLLSELSIRRFDGQLLARRTSYDDEVRRKYGNPICCLHRVDLHIALAQRASELGAELRLGSKVLDVDFDQNSIMLSQGNTEHGDLIVAADGLWSTTRSIFLAHDSPPKPTGDLAYRVVLKVDELDSPELIELVNNRSLNLWIGPDKHAVGFGIRNAKLFNMAFLAPDTLPEGIHKHSGAVDSLRQLFKGWDPILTKLMGTMKTVETWKLMHCPPLERLATDSGRFIMVGDSCHPMLPYIAQGANSALEDAAVLGHLLSKTSSCQDLRTVASLYQSLRQERVSYIYRETFKHRDEFHLRDGQEQVKRDELLKKSFTSDDWTHPKIQPMVFSYDAYEAAEEACNKQGLARIEEIIRA